LKLEREAKVHMRDHLVPSKVEAQRFGAPARIHLLNSILIPNQPTFAARAFAAREAILAN
jgi:hypothetical protein